MHNIKITGPKRPLSQFANYRFGSRLCENAPAVYTKQGG